MIPTLREVEIQLQQLLRATGNTGYHYPIIDDTPETAADQPQKVEE